MDNIIIPQAALFMGIIPALLILYVVLKGYEGLYQEKNIFLTFVVGIVMGVITAFAQSFTSAGTILYMILIALFAQLFKTIALNLRRFHEKQETVIYGLSLGLGFGAAFTPYLVIAVSSMITSDTLILTLITIGSFGMLFFHSATGMLIGYGIFKKKLMIYLVSAILLQVPFNAFTDLMIISTGEVNPYLPSALFVTALLIYSIILFVYVTIKILPNIKPQSGRRKRLTKQQKEKEEEVG